MLSYDRFPPDHQEVSSKMGNHIEGELRQVDESLGHRFHVVMGGLGDGVTPFDHLKASMTEKVGDFRHGIFPEVGPPLITGVLIVHWDQSIEVRAGRLRA